MHQDYRLFKLSHVMDLECCQEVFGEHILPPYENEAGRPSPVRFLIEARCKSSVKWRIVDGFGPKTPEELLNGDFMFTAECSDRENLSCWILSLGDQIELLKPCEFHGELAELGRRVYGIHR